MQARTAAKILSEMDAPTDRMDAVGLYVTVKNTTANAVDVSPENITSLTVVAKVSEVHIVVSFVLIFYHCGLEYFLFF